jgi:hypothetical protein
MVGVVGWSGWWVGVVDAVVVDMLPSRLANALISCLHLCWYWKIKPAVAVLLTWFSPARVALKQVSGVSTEVAVSTCGAATQVEVDLTVWAACPNPWAALRAWDASHTSSATTVSERRRIVAFFCFF